MYKKLAKISSLAVAMGGRGLYELDKSANAEILLFLCFFMCTPFQTFFSRHRNIFSNFPFTLLYLHIFWIFFLVFRFSRSQNNIWHPAKIITSTISSIYGGYRIQLRGGGWETLHSPLYLLLSSITYFINKKLLFQFWQLQLRPRYSLEIR